jgi:hypothetical protein
VPKADGIPEIPPAGQDKQQARRTIPTAPMVATNGPKTFILPSIAKDGLSPIAAVAAQSIPIQPVAAQQGNKPAIVLPANYQNQPQIGR